MLTTYLSGSLVLLLQQQNTLNVGTLKHPIQIIKIINIK
jgi:hypothetical protein